MRRCELTLYVCSIKSECSELSQWSFSIDLYSEFGVAHWLATPPDVGWSPTCPVLIWIHTQNQNYL
jgi:hypothetical protein